MHHPPKIIYSVWQWVLSCNKVSRILVALQEVVQAYRERDELLEGFFEVVVVKLF